MRQPNHDDFGLTPQERATVARDHVAYNQSVLGGQWKDMIRSVIGFVQIRGQGFTRIGFDKLAALTTSMLSRALAPKPQPTLAPVPTRPQPRLGRQPVPGQHSGLHLH
jgi:hypothetical protein